MDPSFLSLVLATTSLIQRIKKNKKTIRMLPQPHFPMYWNTFQANTLRRLLSNSFTVLLAALDVAAGHISSPWSSLYCMADMTDCLVCTWKTSIDISEQRTPNALNINSFYVLFYFSQKTYTRQLRSARSSMKSNNWLMSYVMEGLFGFILFKCSSYILQTPEEKFRKQVNGWMDFSSEQ